ncbi:MAG: hypothetical protein FJ090_02490 [Deltaproteobacteria bacterium]|nr:hypothetical protein [Deltaproteobacteria bacterium]
MSRWWLTLALAGCGPGEEDTQDTGDDGGVECGDPVAYDIEVTAKVVDQRGAGLEGVEVGLDDRGWNYEILGSGTTNRGGMVTFTAAGVTALDGCWATVLNYWIVATDPSDESRTAEDDMNTELYNAIDNGSLATDVSDFPLEL